MDEKRPRVLKNIEVTEKLFSDQVVSSTLCHKWELNSHKHLNIFFKPHQKYATETYIPVYILQKFL
jgi:hypothetical protein